MHIRKNDASTDFERKDEKGLNDRNLVKIVISCSSPNTTIKGNTNFETEKISATKGDNKINSDEQCSAHVERNSNSIEESTEIGKLSQRTSFEDVTPLEFGEIPQRPWVNYGVKSELQNNAIITVQQKSINEAIQASERGITTAYLTSSHPIDIKDADIIRKTDVLDIPVTGIIQISDLKDNITPEKHKSKKLGSLRTLIENEKVLGSLPGEEKNIPRESSLIPKYESLREAIRIR